MPQADPRFLWNNYMLEMLIDNKVCLFPKFLLIHHTCSIVLELIFTFMVTDYAFLFVQLDPYLLPVMQGSILNIYIYI